ncbi:MAG: A24 family peptidase [Anaerolineales bacterium]
MLIFLLTISIYDLRTHRIPNWCSIPLIVTGLILHFPGCAELWLASFFLFTAWIDHVMGAGDAKLWIGLLWALPVEFTSASFLLLCIAFVGTALLQMIWRHIRKQQTVDVLAPAAWRTIPFLLLVWYVH